MTKTLTIIALLFLCSPLDVLAQSACNADYLGNVSERCCGITVNKKRRRCIQRMIGFTKKRKFIQLIGSDATNSLRSNLIEYKVFCPIAMGAGSLRGSLPPLSALFARPDNSCSETTDESNYPYVASTIVVSRTANYIINIKTSGGCSSVATLYDATFNPADATESCTFYTEGEAVNGASTASISAELVQDVEYTLVVSTNSAANNCSYTFAVGYSQ